MEEAKVRNTITPKLQAISNQIYEKDSFEAIRTTIAALKADPEFVFASFN